MTGRPHSGDRAAGTVRMIPIPVLPAIVNCYYFALLFAVN